MHETFPPVLKSDNLSSILVLNITGETKLNSITEQKIRNAIYNYDGKLLTWLNTEIIIIFSSNTISEKHASRAYFCYQSISQIAETYSFSTKAFLNCAHTHFDGSMCLDSLPQISRDIFYSDVAQYNENILFSESAIQLLENDFIFQPVHKRKKLKLFTLRGTKNNMPESVFAGRKIEQELIHKSLLANYHTCICGPAGIGKTSLVEHSLKKTDYLIIHCSFYRNTYAGLYKQLFDELLSYIEPHGAEVSVPKIDILRTVVNITDEEKDFLSNLYDEVYLQKNHLHLGANLFLKCLSEIIPNRKICLFFDDIQWATEEFEEFCGLVINDYLRIISTSRTPPKNKENCVVVTLKPLLQDDILSIAQELIPYDMITQNLINTIFAETSGNPYYLREILKSLHTRMPLDNKDLTQLPLSLKNLIAHQLSLLSEELRLTLEICSCIQQRFSVGLIQNICGEDQYMIRDKLNRLCEADFLRFSMRTNSYEFIHSLKEKNVYDSIPKAQRIALHRRIVSSLEEQTGGKAYPLLSQQLFYAEMWRQSYQANLKDARLYIKNLAPRMAMEAIKRCMTSANKMHVLTKVRKIRLQLMLNTVYFIFGEVKSAQRLITPVKDLFLNKELLRYPQIWNAALNELTFFYWISAQYEQALNIIEQAETDFSFVLNSATSGALSTRRIGIYSDIGKLEESNREINLLVSSEQQDGFENWTSIFPVKSVLYALKSRNHAYMRQYDAFEANAFKALKLSSEQTASSTQILTLCYVADGYIHFQKFDRAQVLLDQAITLMNKAHIYVLKSYAMSMMGYCKAANGEEKGISDILNAIYDAQINGRLGRLPLFYLYLAKSLQHVAEKSGTKRYLTKGLKLAKAQGEEWICNQISTYANNMNIQLEKPKTSKENVINFFDYVTSQK